MFKKGAWLLLMLAFTGYASAATITANSCNYADVKAAIDSSTSGDTIIVPEGTCTWNSRLGIGKTISLIGSGKDKTTIVSNYVSVDGNSLSSANYLISYTPSSYSHVFRISGFTFDFNSKCGGIMLMNSKLEKSMIRIDSNVIKNSNAATMSARAIIVKDTTYGVIDQNEFSNNAKHIDYYAADEAAWKNFDFTFGSGDCLYYEDNVFYLKSTPHSAGAGARYCARYNTYIKEGTGGLYPWFDMHGNQPNAHTATMGAEIYGNLLTNANGVGMFDQRGGKALLFGNKGSGSCSAKVREEYSDSMNPPATSPSGQPQHVSGSYYWNNHCSGLVSLYIDEDDYDRSAGIVNSPPLLVEGITHYNQRSPFDGTSGVGCGPLSARPGTCKAGVGYWATEQSCAGAESAGANPSQPLSGTLHKCTSTNTWTAFYTPYTYPHTLRSDDTCADECLSGARQCSSASSYRMCADYDLDSCAEWGNSVACPSGQTCVNGICSGSAQAFTPGEIVEAEAGNLQSMQTVSGYIFSPSAEQGSASYRFEITQAGEYIMEALVSSSNDPGRNSFYIGLDAENAKGNNTFAYDATIAQGFVWDNVTKRGTGTVSAEFDPMFWDLAAGTHTFTFYGREANTWLDKIMLKKACVHTADTDCDSCIRQDELMQYIQKWKSGQTALASLMESIKLWKQGC